jgi:protein required for attachment to host cells
MSETTHTKMQLQERLMIREKRFGELLIAAQPPMLELPGKINAKGVLTVPVDEIKKYIAIQKADAAHAAIQAFLETTFEEDNYD